jgi:hypothetical protein
MVSVTPKNMHMDFIKVVLPFPISASNKNTFSFPANSNNCFAAT